MDLCSPIKKRKIADIVATAVMTAPVKQLTPRTPSPVLQENSVQSASDPPRGHQRGMTTGDARASVHLNTSLTASPSMKRRRDTLGSDFAPSPVCQAPAGPSAQPPVTEVFDSEASLRPGPGCLECHGKGKLPATEPNESGVECGEHPSCRETNLIPLPERHANLRLTTANPLEDIKRWLTTPNSTLFRGERTSRKSSWKSLSRSMDRTTRDDMEKGIEFAIQQALWRRASIEGLHSYSKHNPHYLALEDPFAGTLEPDDMPMGPGLKYEHMDWLTGWLCKMATELDALCTLEEQLVEGILTDKWYLAVEYGDTCEIDQLLALGMVSKEQVMEHCGIP